MNKFVNMRLVVILLMAGFLAGCESSGFMGSGSLGGESVMLQSLPRADKSAARDAIEQALASPTKKSVRWGNTSSGNSGTVKPSDALIAGLSDDGLLYAAPPGLSTDVPLETALGVYTLNQNSNIRLGPSTSDQRLKTLDQGTKVTALGRHNASNWYLIGQGERVIGYIYGTLISQSGASSAMLMGGPTVRPQYCRSYRHAISLRDGRSDTVSETVCRRSNGRWAPLR